MENELLLAGVIGFVVIHSTIEALKFIFAGKLKSIINKRKDRLMPEIRIVKNDKYYKIQEKFYYFWKDVDHPYSNRLKFTTLVDAKKAYFSQKEVHQSKLDEMNYKPVEILDETVLGKELRKK